MQTGFVVLIAVLLILLWSGIRIFNEYERGVIFRLGRISSLRTAGIKWIIPIVDRLVRVDLRVIVMDVPPQDVITRDNVSVKVNAVVYFRVIDPIKATIVVKDFLYATSQLSQTTLRSVLGQSELDDLLSQRDKINRNLQEILDGYTEPWGIKVSQVEVKHLDLPMEMQRSIARQAEAERERRGKVIAAEGEYQAAQKLSDAGKIMAQNPVTLQLRYLQTLVQIATEKNSVTLFPIPIDMLSFFMNRDKKD